MEGPRWFHIDCTDPVEGNAKLRSCRLCNKQLTQSQSEKDIGQNQDDQEFEHSSSSMKFNVTAGAIATSKLVSFERILWRIAKGNVFLKTSPIDDDNIIDPATGQALQKSLFLMFFQGEELKIRVKKVCEGYHADVYPCPDSLAERTEMLAGVEARLEDLARVLQETNDHRMNFLNDRWNDNTQVVYLACRL